MMPEVQDKDQEEIHSSTLRLIACPNLFLDHGRIDRYVPAGGSITDHIRALGWDPDTLNARVCIDGTLVPHAYWERVRPKGNHALTIRVVPTGGEGGKMALRIVAMIALVVAAAYTGGALAPLIGPTLGITTTAGISALAAGITATLSVAGSLAISALIPPPRPRYDLLGQSDSSPTLSLTGASNQFAPYGVIPRVLGRHRLYPPLAARPFTEVVGNDQYLRLLFCCGYGPLALANFKIGETPLEQFQGVELEVRYGYDNDAPLTLFPADVYEDNLSILLTDGGGWQQRTSQPNATELSVDVTFPTGLFMYLETTRFQGPQTIDVNVEYRLVGTPGWTTAVSQPLTFASVQTAFSGANNDLVFTAVTGGTFGNSVVVQFVAGEALQVTAGAQFYEESTILMYRYVLIGVVNGVTTAAAVKAAVEANSAAAGLISVTHAIGNNGTGAITLSGTGENFQLAGGLEQVPLFRITGNDRKQLRFSRRWTVPVGQYDVRVSRATVSIQPPDAQIVDASYWTSLRTIQAGRPVGKKGMCLIALRIKATDQLNGTVDQFNVVAQSIVPDWDGTAWRLRPTSNPASLYREILQGKANKRPKPDSRLDLPVIQDFHARCAAQGFAFNAAIDFRTTVKQLRQDVLAAGRGAFGLRDMKYSVIQDLLQATPVDVITPRTAHSFQWTKRFVDMPHGFKVSFVDEANGWKRGERIVYADGYDATNATNLEEVDAGLGVTNSDQVWKLKRRELADALLRADDYSVQMDFAHLTFTRGDRLQVQYDVILAGLLTARIKTVTLNGSNEATAITVDDVFTMAAGTAYGARIKRATGVQTVHALVTVPGETNSVGFVTPIAVGSVPAIGDLVIFGELGRESLDAIVKRIEPGPDYSATVNVVDYAPAIQSADSGTIPPYDPHITLPSEDRRILPLPIIDQVQSDETVLFRDVDGSFQSRILVTLHFASGFRLPVTKIEAQYRPTGYEVAWAQVFAPVSGTASEVSILPVADGQMYDVRIRTVNDDTGATSDWVTTLNHTVIGKTTAPPNVPLLIFDGDLLRWSYPNPPRDLAGFRIKSRPGVDAVWAEGTTLHDYLVSDLFFPLVTDGLVRVFMVKAVDVAGNESATPASVIYAGGPLVLGNLAATFDERANGFSGTKSNGTVVAGDLKADSETVFWTNDSASFWTSDSATFWTGSYKTMTYTFTVAPPANWLAGKLRISLGITAGSWSLKYRPDAQKKFWTSDGAAFWTSDGAAFWQGSRPDFMTWPGAIGPMTAQSYEFQIQASGGAIQAVISALQILFDMPDLRESIIDLAIPAGGRRLPITKDYQYIKTVQLTPKTPQRIPAVLDKDYLAGPFVELDDLAGVDAEGIADAEVVGF